MLSCIFEKNYVNFSKETWQCTLGNQHLLVGRVCHYKLCTLYLHILEFFLFISRCPYLHSLFKRYTTLIFSSSGCHLEFDSNVEPRYLCFGRMAMECGYCAWIIFVGMWQLLSFWIGFCLSDTYVPFGSKRRRAKVLNTIFHPRV